MIKYYQVGYRDQRRRYKCNNIVFAELLGLWLSVRHWRKLVVIYKVSRRDGAYWQEQVREVW